MSKALIMRCLLLTAYQGPMHSSRSTSTATTSQGSVTMNSERSYLGILPVSSGPPLVSEDTESCCTRCRRWVSLRHGNAQRVDTAVQEDRVHPGRLDVPRSQEVFITTSGAQTKRLVFRYYFLLHLRPIISRFLHLSEQRDEILARPRLCT